MQGSEHPERGPAGRLCGRSGAVPRLFRAGAHRPGDCGGRFQCLFVPPGRGNLPERGEYGFDRGGPRGGGAVQDAPPRGEPAERLSGGRARVKA